MPRIMQTPAHHVSLRTADTAREKHLAEYSELVSAVDEWFNRCMTENSAGIACIKGCSDCCRGLFDITILDAALLKSGFDALPEDVKNRISSKAASRVNKIRSIWPEFAHPFILNNRPENEVEKLLATDNDSPCVLLDNNGSCLLYAYRPMTCRLHGLPLIDLSGEVLEEEWCTKNFSAGNPCSSSELRGDFARIFTEEGKLGRGYTAALLGKAVNALDTLIPTALLIDFKGFDWRKWFAENTLKT